MCRSGSTPEQTLVQGYTAFIYRGPLWARQVNRGLLRLRRQSTSTSAS